MEVIEKCVEYCAITSTTGLIYCRPKPFSFSSSSARKLRCEYWYSLDMQRPLFACRSATNVATFVCLAAYDGGVGIKMFYDVIVYCPNTLLLTSVQQLRRYSFFFLLFYFYFFFAVVFIYFFSFSCVLCSIVFVLRVRWHNK